MNDPTRRETDRPKGNWVWAKGPPWWRQMPAVWKALGILAFAFMAGVTTWATVATQFGLPAIVSAHALRIDTLEEWQDSVDALIPILEEDHELIKTHKMQLDSTTSLLDRVWCVMSASAHKLDPLNECFVPRPNGRRPF